MNITKGKTAAPMRLVVYGEPGVGKSTFAAQFPEPVFVQTEDGLGNIDTDKFPVSATFAEVLQHLKEIHDEPHEYRTVVVDSLDWLEPLIWAKVCQDSIPPLKHIDEFGYGKGYNFAEEYWKEFLKAINAIRSDRRMNVVLVAHAATSKIERPGEASYDRWCLKLHKRAAARIEEWADIILLAKRNIVTSTKKDGMKTVTRAEAIEQNGSDRILVTDGGPQCLAKSRFPLPAELPLSYEAFVAEFKKNFAK